MVKEEVLGGKRLVFVSLAQARGPWEDGLSVEELPLSDWPMGE